MRTKKQLIVCLTVCLVFSFVSAVCAAPSTVIIGNDNNNPVPVTEVKRQPIHKTVALKICGYCGLNCPPGCSFLSNGWIAVGEIYMVPIGQNLVIEYFSCRNGNAGSYGTSYSCWISTSTSGEYVDHYLPTTPYGHYEVFGGGSDTGTPQNPPAFMSAGQRVQIYADPLTEVDVGVFRQRNNISAWSWNYDEYMVFSFSGYLLDEVPLIFIPSPIKK